MGDPDGRASTVVLRDGSTVQVRPLGPGDEGLLGDLLAGLTIESLTYRFFAPVANFESMARRLAAPEPGRHSLIALGQSGRAVAHATYVAGNGGRAEMALTVADEYQGRGLGTIMLGQLAELAHGAGVDTFDAIVLPSNQRMIDMLRASGFPVRTRWEPGELIAEFPTDLGEETLEKFAERERVASAAAVRHLLAPASVAVVGASRSPRGVGRRILDNLATGGYRGKLYAVNPNAEAIAGVDCFPNVAAIPGPVELAVLAVPPGAVAHVARDCAARGVAGLVVVTAGFAESGSEGARLQAELVAICRESGMRLVGPNCVGIVNTDPSVRLSATFAPGAQVPGNVGFLSQSGALGLALMARAERLGLGLSSFVSAGNKADISGNDLLQYWEDDPRTEVILLYLESFGNPRRFARLARRISRAKPIVAVKSGRSAAGARGTGSHTGALVRASDVTVDALFAQAGVIRTETLAEMFDVTMLLARQPLPAGRRVGIVTNAGGPGILCADACAALGLDVVELTAGTRSRLVAALPSGAATPNPVDLLADASARDFAGALDVLLDANEVDAAIVVVTATEAVAARDLAEVLPSLRSREIPLLAVCVGVDDSAGFPLPAFTFPEEAAQALAHAARYSAWRSRPEPEPESPPGTDRAAAAELIAGVLTTGAGWIPKREMARLLRCYGIALIESRVENSPEVQRMAPDGVEMLVGMVHDGSFGPVLACGAGGTAAELLHDVSVRITPVTRDEVREMIRSLATFPMLDGYRGAPRADVAALEDVLLRVAALVEAHPEIVEMDLNPVLVHERGVSVVDARIRLEPAPPAIPLSAR